MVQVRRRSEVLTIMHVEVFFAGKYEEMKLPRNEHLSGTTTRTEENRVVSFGAPTGVSFMAQHQVEV